MSASGKECKNVLMCERAKRMASKMLNAKEFGLINEREFGFLFALERNGMLLKSRKKEKRLELGASNLEVRERTGERVAEHR